MPGLVLLLAALLLAACGSADEATDEPELTIYISAPLVRGEDFLPQDAIDGAQRAIDEAGGEAGGIDVLLRPLTGSYPGADPRTTAALNARRAARDSTAIAYIGEFHEGATASSLSITDAAGIPQVMPSPQRGPSLGAYEATKTVLEAVGRARDPLDRTAVTDALP